MLPLVIPQTRQPANPSTRQVFKIDFKDKTYTCKVPLAFVGILYMLDRYILQIADEFYSLPRSDCW